MSRMDEDRRNPDYSLDGTRRRVGVFWGPKLDEYIFVQGPNMSGPNMADIIAAIQAVDDAKRTGFRRGPADNWQTVSGKPVQKFTSSKNFSVPSSRHLAADCENAPTEKLPKRDIYDR